MAETDSKKVRAVSPEVIAVQEKATAFVRHANEHFAMQNGFRKKAYILTFGCQQNEADGEKIAGMCEQMGYEMTTVDSEADLIVVNTCAIREHAEKKALSIIGQFKHLKKVKPDLVVAVCGCMVSQAHRVEQIKMSYPYVDFIFGTASIHRFPELLYTKMEKGKRLFEMDKDSYEFAEGIPTHRNHPFKAWVSIMYGCNNFCSYCIVPYVRGRERSRAKEEVIAEVRELIEKGYKDITLLGQNVNSYGRMDHFDYDFADLLEEIAAIPGDYRLRFMTSHPKDASDKLIDVMARNPHICKQFHLPLQSGSDSILKAMNRHYDYERYRHIVQYLREKMPDCVITSDIIVGFPGETEEDFEATLNAIKEFRYDMLYAFIYSPRVGTPAASMENQIPADVQGARFQRLLEIQNQIAFEKNSEVLHTAVRVLCEGPSKENHELYSGRTDGGKMVFFSGGEEGDAGQYLDIQIDRADPYALFGKKQ